VRRFVATLILISLLIGCVHRPLPGIYASVSPPEALAILRQRCESIRTLSSQGFITLTRPSGDSIRLDAALVARIPGDLHLRAWKFNRTVFDLTLTPAGLWMLAPDEPRMQQQVESGKSGTIQFARAWSLLTHDFFFSPDLATRIKGPDLLITRQNEATRVICAVDRGTLTPRKYTLYDPKDHRQFVLRLDDYSLHDGIAYPGRMIAESRFGRVEVRLRQIQINAPLAPGAFVPSTRAEKVQ
jgi:hypothetical protein